MPSNDVIFAGARATRQPLVAAMVTFVSSTLPPLLVSHLPTTKAIDGMFPTIPDNDADAQFLAACTIYHRRLVESGRAVGPAITLNG